MKKDVTKLKKALKKLIGYKLIELDDKHLTISNDIKTYILNILSDDDNGCDCYNWIEIDFYEKTKPIITNIKVENGEVEDWGNSERVIITFYENNKVIAKISSTSGTGCGWCHGAEVSISCKDLEINEIITDW